MQSRSSRTRYKLWKSKKRRKGRNWRYWPAHVVGDRAQEFVIEHVKFEIKYFMDLGQYGVWSPGSGVRGPEFIRVGVIVDVHVSR